MDFSGDIDAEGETTEGLLTFTAVTIESSPIEYDISDSKYDLKVNVFDNIRLWISLEFVFGVSVENSK